MKDNYFFLILLFFSIGVQSQNGFDPKMKSSPAPFTVSNNQKIDASSKAQNPGGNLLLKSSDGSLVSCKVEYNQHNGLLRFLKGKLITIAQNDEQGILDQLYSLFAANTELFGIQNPKDEWILSNTSRHEDGSWKFAFQQSYNSINYFAADIKVNIKSDGVLILTGQYESTPAELLTIPAIPVEQAVLTCKADLGKHTTYKEFGEAENKYYKQGQFVSDLVIFKHPVSGDIALCWHISARPNFLKLYEYFINAENGEIAYSYDHTCEVGPVTATATDLNGASQTIHVWQNSSSSYTMIDASRAMYSGNNTQTPDEGDGIIITLNMQNTPLDNPSYAEVTSTNNNWANSPKSVSAHNHAGLCYEYFRNTHSRNSINGQNGDIVSFINVADEDGGGLDNAFWNGEYMFYGSGAQAFSALSGALDVGGHEMSHGVIQNTANLEYYGESGAINESIADCFATMIDRNDWKLGEDIVNTQYFPSGALRDMSNPHNGCATNSQCWQPAHMSEKYNGTQDNAGVHINSGIPNKAFYNLATAITKEKAERIYYKALDDYLTRSSKFADLRIAVMEAAGDLYGAAEQNAVATAFDGVGIAGAAGPGDYETDINENPGEEFVISLDTNPNDPATLYRSTPQGTNYEILTNTEVIHKPTITDNGETLLFVDGDHNLRHINLAQSNFPEEILTNDQYWDNVAISKDGSKYAAISRYIDTTIYVGNFNTGAYAEFKLYNPTFSSGINSSGVLYADVIEWDYTGENLIYDAYNKIPQENGDSLTYWDMGIINVWDNSSNNFADGYIQKIFTNLPDGISIGNPTFSKNSPYIIAFDLIDSNDGSYAVMGANMETGDNGVIVANNTLGYPSYSIDDTKMAYTNNGNNGQAIAVINLAANKISASGSPTLEVIPVADWPLWYANGDRPLLGIEDLSSNAINAKLYPNPTNSILFLSAELAQTEEVVLNVYDITGKLLIEYQTQLSNNQPHRMDVSNLNSGFYMLKIKGKNIQGTMNFILSE